VERRRPELRASYRLQLNGELGFAAATELADYLAELGISHLYASPVLQAARGSTHGYDVVDHGSVSAELGGEREFDGMCEALRARGLGVLLDIVPNHMAIGTAQNALWWDVLENGPASEYAGFFDVDWDAAADNRVLLPILGERYVEALEQGSIRLVRGGARFVARYHDHALPAAPRSLEPLLAAAARSERSEELAFVADKLGELPHAWTTDRASAQRRRRDVAVLFAQLERLLTGQAALAAAIDRELDRLNADRARFDAWLERQNWQLAYWRAAATELGYRRFFDIQGLCGLRMEDDEVFARTHARVLAWLQQGRIDGVRIDHPDGLRDPEQYLQRLHAAAPHAYVVVEKILQPGETLRASWPVAGTTGYELIRLQDQLQVDPGGAAQLDGLYERIAGPQPAWDARVREAKLHVLDRVLASERERMVELAYRMTRGEMALRDFTRAELRAAVTELLAGYNVYRSYVRPGAAVDEADRALIATALATASAQLPEMFPRIWRALEDALLLRSQHALAQEFALAVQQLTGAVTAKAIEDTVFYRHVRLCALNEVGGSPERFGISLAEFHAAIGARGTADGMIASTTHDTKRSEDVRSRLLVLSELAEEWSLAVGRWLERGARQASAAVVDAATQYLFYQTLVGAFPLELERAQSYMQKAVREAKTHTSWTSPDMRYEAAVAEFVRGVLEDRALMDDVAAFVALIAPPGFVASLGKTLVKLTLPGLPDFYQGSELWDLRLVDPDNRGPVDFALRRALLARCGELDAEGALRELTRGTPKLWMIARTLRLRAREPERFAGPYAPLDVRGPDAQAVLAFTRGSDGAALAVIVPRWPVRAAKLGDDVLVALPAGRWRNALSDEPLEVREGGISARALWARFPVALLTRST
jgi:(1->4)-alpha-D-glucan 1-alpha-D-glucosylmutase